MGLDAYVPCSCEQSDSPCQHSGKLIEKRLGNASMVGYVAEFIAAEPGRFPVFEKQVVYSGSHSGDAISPKEAEFLLKEAEELKRCVDRSAAAFASDVWELAVVSVKVGNPIEFV
jgi:hypothetical protein